MNRFENRNFDGIEKKMKMKKPLQLRQSILCLLSRLLEGLESQMGTLEREITDLSWASCGSSIAVSDDSTRFVRGEWAETEEPVDLIACSTNSAMMTRRAWQGMI